MHDSNVHLKYRADVDGLRAVAVLAVFVFHLFPKLLPGGYVGVDVFFVISGYLISGIILRSLEKGSFSFADFYIKRANRIFPSLLLVLSCTFAFGWYYLLQDEFESLGKHIHKATAFFANIAYYKEAGYFDAAAELKPLLHMWSLGIEEQFYFIWPLMLFAFWKFSKVRTVRNVGILLGLSWLVSFLLSLYIVRRDVGAAFYLPHYRFWELLTGAALAYSETFYKNSKINKLFPAELKSVVGLLFILGSIFTFDGQMGFPGFWALFPTVGALLMISAGAKTKINHFILANPVMVWIGLISYPLYLWHWPLFSMGRIIKGGEPDLYVKLILGVLSFVLAWLTFKFLEKPLKTDSKIKRLNYAYVLSALMIVLSVTGVIVRKKIIVARANQGELQKILDAFYDWQYPSVRVERREVAPGVTGFFQGAAEEKVLFMGDSNIEQYYPRVDHLLTNNPSVKRSAVFITTGGCVPIAEARNQIFNCPAVIAAAKKYAEDPSVSTVVLGAQWMGYLHKNGFARFEKDGKEIPMDFQSEGYYAALKSISTMIQNFVAKGKKVHFILNIPVDMAFNPRSMIQRDFPSGKFQIIATSFDKESFDKKYLPIKNDLEQMAQKAGANVFDPMPLFCDSNTCPTVDARNEPIYKDEGHVRPFAIIERATFLDPLFL